ncbi:DUF5076 domain-containing protein [Sphingobium abikonense]|jgi:hypothetical protein|uniref:DUF5076 domain-containing protein n=1 Tax=Sphingobium abikonense TaxID=86193 RepID=UPI00351984CD
MIGFRKKAEHPGAISLENGDNLTSQSAEVARIWVTDNAGSSVWIDARVLADPIAFGYLVADTMRHAARAYATTYDANEEAMLQAISDGVVEELREQFANITTIQEGKLN